MYNKYIMKKNIQFKSIVTNSKLLNQNGFNLAADGVGSIGNETTYFGSLTKNALSKYQTANTILPSVGYFGPITRAQMKSAEVSGLWW